MARLAASFALLAAAGFQAPLAAQGTVLVGGDLGSDRAAGDTTEDPGDAAGATTPGAGPLRGGDSGALAGPSVTGIRSASGLAAHGDLDRWSWWWEFRRDAVLLDRPAPSSAAAPLDPGPALDVLLAGLEGEHQVAPLRAAILAAAQIADDATPERRRVTTERLEALLPHRDARVVETAILGLGLLGGERPALVLADLLRGKDEGLARLAPGRRSVDRRERGFAAVALALAVADAGHADLARFAVHHLDDVLRDSVEDEPELAIACLTGLALVPLPFDPADAFDTVELEELASARTRPASASGDAQLAALLRRFERASVDRTVRPHLATTLGALAADREVPPVLQRWVVEALLDGLGDRRDADLRRACALALGWVADADAGGPDARARTALARAAERAPDALTRSLAWMSWIEASTRAGVRGDAVGPAVVVDAVLSRPDRVRGLERSWATLAVGWCADRLAAGGTVPPPALAELLAERFRREKNPLELESLAAAAGLATVPELRTSLEDHLAKSRVEGVRAAAALALGLLGDPAAGTGLSACVAGSLHEPRLLHEAALALGRLRVPGSVEVLVEALRRAGSIPARGSLATALGSFDDPRSVAALLALFEDEDLPAQLRAYAGVALGRVLDADLPAWRARVVRRVPYFCAPPLLCDDVGNGVLNLL